jgi:hypothetical protein
MGRSNVIGPTVSANANEANTPIAAIAATAASAHNFFITLPFLKQPSALDEKARPRTWTNTHTLEEG